MPIYYEVDEVYESFLPYPCMFKHFKLYLAWLKSLL